MKRNIVSLKNLQSHKSLDFIPFLNERNSMGHIIGSQFQHNLIERKYLRKAEQWVEKKFFQMDGLKIKRSFKLDELSIQFDQTKCQQKKGFSRLSLEKNERKKIKKLPIRKINKHKIQQVHPFYDRHNYQKFYYKRTPSLQFPTINRNKSLKQISVSQQRKKSKRISLKKPLPILKNKSFSNKQSDERQWRELERRLYPDVSQNIEKMDQQFITLKNNLLHLKNQTANLKLSQNSLY